MASLKKLASQTAIYGLSSILGRILNFALTPIHTDALPREEYGQVTDIYSMIAFLMVILTFGMETSFFRFFKDKRYASANVFSTTTALVIFLSLFILLLVYLFLNPISDALKYEGQPQYILWLVMIVSIDAITAVPFARLRAENKPGKFVLYRLSTTGSIVLLNLIFFILMPYLSKNDIWPQLVQSIYDPDLGVTYILLANLAGNVLLLLLFFPDILKIRWRLDTQLMKSLLLYASPLVIAGLAGIANEMANRQFLKYLLPEGENFEALGIFGANVKIATFMMLFIQAFRFAAEPFFFSGEGDFKQKISKVLHYFVLAQSVIFLGLVCFIEVIKWTHFIDEKFWSGLDIVPILLLANLLLGINFNLNIWYKLKNRTRMGAYITFLGLFFTIVANLWLVPQYGYMGAAWATLISYASMTLFSYYLNQKYDRTKYPVKKILTHVFLSSALAFTSFYYFESALLPSTLCFLGYLIFVWYSDGRSIIKLQKR